MRSWKSHRLTSHTWLGLNLQFGRIVGAIGLFFFYLFKNIQKFHESSNFFRKLWNASEYSKRFQKVLKIKKKGLESLTGSRGIREVLMLLEGFTRFYNVNMTQYGVITDVNRTSSLTSI
jgi:hypothetical protein